MLIGEVNAGAVSELQLLAAATVKVRRTDCSTGHPASKRVMTNQVMFPLATLAVSVDAAVVPSMEGVLPSTEAHTSYAVAL